MLLLLWQKYRPALQADFIQTWGQPFSFTFYDWNTLWLMAKEILKDHSSHCWQSLAKYTFYPTVVEQAVYVLNSAFSKIARKESWLQEDKLTSESTLRISKPVDRQKRSKLKELLGDID